MLTSELVEPRSEGHSEERRRPAVVGRVEVTLGNSTCEEALAQLITVISFL